MPLYFYPRPNVRISRRTSSFSQILGSHHPFRAQRGNEKLLSTLHHIKTSLKIHTLFIFYPFDISYKQRRTIVQTTDVPYHHTTYHTRSIPYPSSAILIVTILHACVQKNKSNNKLKREFYSICREFFCFAAVSFFLILPWVLLFCREFFLILPWVLLFCRKFFSYFAVSSFNFAVSSFILPWVFFLFLPRVLLILPWVL